MQLFRETRSRVDDALGTVTDAAEDMSVTLKQASTTLAAVAVVSVVALALAVFVITAMPRDAR
jgi:hypothetical protein